MTQQSITILGATGSIGISTLDVIRRNDERYRVFALTANTQWQRLYQQILEFKPVYAVCFDQDAAQKLKDKLKTESLQTRVVTGLEGLQQVASAPEVDTVVAAIVGAAGLMPTLAAVRAGKKILLANKETLVMAGEYFLAEVQKHKALLLPVDSEHNALFQSLPNHHYQDKQVHNWADYGVTKFVLTASGGPFLDCKMDELEGKTPQQACKHPNWEMGRKISVDSATLMNKGLEVIEACYLYQMPFDNIDVLIHPQSIVHSMVAYRDGSVIAELGNPDMRTPIAHVLSWPERIDSGVDFLDLIQQQNLEFKAVDKDKFPCLELAYEALRLGGTAPAIINAANEVAVAAFLDEKLKFTDIANVIKKTLSESETTPADSLDSILAADKKARELCSHTICSPNYLLTA